MQSRSTSGYLPLPTSYTYSLSRSTNIIKSHLSLKLLINALLGISVLCGIFWWTKFEVHVEIQTYNREWVKETILNSDSEPLDPQCWDPALLVQRGYNLTRSFGPKYFKLDPGIPLRFEQDCFNFASTLPSSPLPEQEPWLPEETIFHTYWRADLLPFGERQELLLKSILVTQDQERTNVILWTNDFATLMSSRRLRLFLKQNSRLTVQQVNLTSLSIDTPLEAMDLEDLRDEKGYLDSDLGRLLMLYKFGGVWIDMDSLMVRNMRALLESEWVTQWDCYDKPYSPFNNAILHFYQSSPYLCEILSTITSSPPPRPGSTDLGGTLLFRVFRKLLRNGVAPFQVLPWCLTDGRSCRIDSRLPDPFAGGSSEDEMRMVEEKVEKIFSIHLHNQWKKELPRDGWIWKLVVEKLL